MLAYSSSDAQRPPAYVMSRIGSHAVHDRRGIIRFRDESLMNNGQVISSNHLIFQELDLDILENLWYFIFRGIQKKKRSLQL